MRIYSVESILRMNAIKTSKLEYEKLSDSQVGRPDRKPSRSLDLRLFDTKSPYTHTIFNSKGEALNKYLDKEQPVLTEIYSE